MIAIQYCEKENFCHDWMKYYEKNNIPFKKVNSIIY